MVQPAFEIGITPAAEMPGDARLLIEISAQALNYIVYTKDPYQLFSLRQYRMYTTSDRSACDVIEEIIAGDETLQQFAAQAVIIYNFPGADIVPAEHYTLSLKNPISKLLTGDAGSDIVFDEPVRDWNMNNIYRVSKDVHLLCRDKFKSNQHWHIYTLILLWSKNERLKNGNIIRTVFYNDKFIVAFFKEEKLQLIQTFSYHTPEDVAYHLLLICRQFNISQQEIILEISGLIDSQSALYTELLKYFVEVNYEELPETYNTNGILGEFPQHYFSPLLKMSLCV
jgi:hypothetical protein